MGSKVLRLGILPTGLCGRGYREAPPGCGWVHLIQLARPQRIMPLLLCVLNSVLKVSSHQLGFAAEKRFRHVRSIAESCLAPLAESIDREGFYPRSLLEKLAAAGAFSAHLHSHGEPGDLGFSIQLIAAIARVCGSTGFVGWCQAACGLYLEESGNPILQDEPLGCHIRGEALGGTGLSNPIKFYAGIEKPSLRARAEGEGYRLWGALPWVSHLLPDGYCGVIAAVVDPNGRPAGHEVMVLLRASAPGVELRPCPAFSGMEGTSTFALRLDEVWIGPESVIARKASTFIAAIRPSFVLLQCGFGLGVTQGAIDSIAAVQAPLGHVNHFLEDQVEPLQTELDALHRRIQLLAKTPRQTDDAYRLAVLEARADTSQLSLRAAQAALLHQGARGYLASSAVQRRIRESHFVAIVTPALKQLRKEIHSLRQSLSAEDSLFHRPTVQPIASRSS
jgi:alkylation response protein AidB-like acyl-CoA dehydrogenase